MPNFSAEDLLQQAMSLIQRAQMHLDGIEVTDDDVDASKSCLHFAYAMLALQGAAIRKERRDAADER